jgi:rRNA processing protein Krr1/Pno1
MIRKKLYLPQDGVNYIGLLIGPRGMFQKKLEGESGCKILIRGKGSQKEGQPPQPDDDDDQHVLIMGDTQEAVERAVEACNKIILADEDTRNMIRKEQLKVAAEMNNTSYSSYDNKAPVDESMLTPYGPPSPYAYIIPVPNESIGLIIGKKGETIRRLQLDSGAKIQVAKKEIEESGQRYVFVEGTEDKYLHAKRLIEEIVDEWRRIHQKPVIPLESKPSGGPAQTVPIPNNLIGLLTGESRDRHDPKQPDILPLIHDRYNVKIYIPDKPDHTGNRNVEVSGEPDKVVRALEDLFSYLREKAPGTNLMMNPLYYASAVGWPKYAEYAYPSEVPRGQAPGGYPPSGYGYPPQQMGGYPPQYPPQRPNEHGYPDHGGHHGYPGSYPPQGRPDHPPSSQPHDSRYGQQQPQYDNRAHSQPRDSHRPEEKKGEEGSQPRPERREPTEERKDHATAPSPSQPAEPPKKEPHPLAHQYASHYSKTLGGDYQYYYDYYMKTYANAAPAPQAQASPHASGHGGQDRGLAEGANHYRPHGQ